MFLIIVFTPLDYTWSQGNTVISYDQEDGLCGQNQISCFVEKSGKLWANSYMGESISYFDGSHWHCQSEANAVIRTSAPEYLQDAAGNVWAFNPNKGMTIISKEDHRIYKFGSKDLPGTYDHYIDKDVLCIIDKKDFSVYKFDPSRKEFILDPLQSERNKILKDKNLNFHNLDPSSGSLFYSYMKFNKGVRNFYPLVYKEGVISELKDNNKLVGIKGNLLFKYSNNIFILDINQIRVKNIIDNRDVILPTPFKGMNKEQITLKIKVIKAHNYDLVKQQFIVIYELAEKNRYLLVEYDIKSLKVKQSLIYHSDYQPHGVCKDLANTYWVATEANMQRILPYQIQLSPSHDNFPSQTWSLVQAQDGNMWLSSYGNGLAKFDGNKIESLKSPFFSEARFDDVSIQYNGQMLFNLEGAGDFTRENNYKNGILVFDGVHPPKVKLEGEIGFFFGRNNKGELMRGTFGKGLWILPKGKEIDDEKNWFKIDSSKGMMIGNVLAALQDQYDRYWMGLPRQGFAIYDQLTKTSRNFLLADNKNGFGVMSMDQDIEGNIWAGSKNGLYFIKNTKDLFKEKDFLKDAIKISPDIIGNSLVNICKVFNKHTLVVGNLDGYFLLDLEYYYKNAGKVKFNSIHKLGFKNYLGGQTNQNGVTFDRDSNIWIVTTKGVYKHSPLLYVQDTLPTTLILDSMNVGNRVFKFERKNKCIELLHTERSFTIYFHHEFSPFLYDNVLYRFRIDSSKAWSPLSAKDSINYQNLSPGNYNLQIQAIKNGMESPIKNISFTIDRVLWLKWWFWLGIGSIIFSVLLFLYTKQRRILSQKLALSQKETEVEIMSKEKDRLHVQAIVNQLNPHFINNALQWLQVRVDDDKEAVKVIGKLSENISTVFKNSRKQINYHSLREEIQLTNNYLFIQKCRFGDKLNVEVPSHETLTMLETFNVPIMMVQIHAENAIEHGIRNNDNGGGTVGIEVTDNGDSFIISVSDDGIGRERSKIIGSKGTQNGTKMLTEIEKIFNKQNKLKISQQYIDGIYTDSEGSTYGTKVIITVPKQYTYIL